MHREHRRASSLLVCLAVWQHPCGELTNTPRQIFVWLYHVSLTSVHNLTCPPALFTLLWLIFLLLLLLLALLRISESTQQQPTIAAVSWDGWSIIGHQTEYFDVGYSDLSGSWLRKFLQLSYLFVHFFSRIVHCKCFDPLAIPSWSTRGLWLTDWEPLGSNIGDLWSGG